MGGRGSGSGIGGFPGVPNIAGLKDSDDFRTFTRQNMDNPEFKAFGRSEGIAAVKQMWYARQIQNENIHEISKEDAIAIVRDNVPQNIRDGWFRDADSDYKPKLMDAVASNPGTYNAGLNIAYRNYKDRNPSSAVSFQQWVRTPQTMYRGDVGQRTTKNDIFTSYTPDRSVASGFGSNISTIRIAPIRTFGSYQTTGEQEYLIPVDMRRKR